MAEKGARSGVLSVVGSVVGVAGLVWVWAISTTSFTPGNAFVAGGALVGLVGWLAAVGLGVASLKTGGRTLGIVGLIVAAVTIAGFVYMIVTLGS